MKLSSKQIEYINKEKEILIRLIYAKEKSETWRGLGADRQKLQMIQLIIDLHNLEIIKKDETQNNKSSGESTPNSDVYKE
jgi:hypothetical protein